MTTAGLAPVLRPGRDDDAAAELERNWADFNQLLAHARAQVEGCRWERAAVACQVAATHAWFNHPGIFASSELERLVGDVGARLPRRPRPAPRRGVVLHVATELYSTGGHTQMLANWLATDPAHEHRICLTAQRGRPLPAKVLEAQGPRMHVTELDRSADRLIDRAERLRELAADAACVVLHPHPHDVVPGLAFAEGHRPPGPVFLVNHADHVFWVGTAAADVVLNMRASGAALTRSRRGVTDDRTDTLIRPLASGRPRPTRSAARERLGLRDDEVVIVTAAAASKYVASDGTGLLDLVRPVLDAQPAARLLAAGPSASGGWADLEREGRGRALGLLPDIGELLAAADLYLDSSPFSSLTSMLEAAATGLPVMTLRPPSDEPDVLGADTPELEESLVVATSPSHYRAELTRLVRDPSARAELGARTRAGVEAVHAEGAWATRVGVVLHRTPVARRVVAEDVRRTGELDRRVARLQARTGWCRGVRGARELNAAWLPLRSRVALVARSVVTGRRPQLRLLLSAASQRRLRRLRSQLAGRGRG